MRFNPTFSSTVTTNIQQSEQVLQTALQQMSTGKRVNVSSDDPAASAALLQSLTQSANDDQYTTNATSALSQAQSSDAVLSSVVSLLNQAVTLGTQGANGETLSGDRQEIATQVQGLLTSLVSDANTTFQGVSLFGGTLNGVAAFSTDAAGAVIYNGDSGVNYVAVGSSLRVQSNVPGDAIFLQPGSSAIGALEALATALASTGTNAQIATAVGAATSQITSALNYVSQQHAIYGNTVNQLTSQETFLAQEQVTLTSQQNSLVGIDTATAAVNLTHAETTNSAILAAAAKVLPTTLLNYLK